MVMVNVELRKKLRAFVSNDGNASSATKKLDFEVDVSNKN